mgnify:CR=1 FL=1|tara:strand:+ start:3610 stop:4026 length:417 start_codon:yes stop_codon:yes gene_type:complete
MDGPQGQTSYTVDQYNLQNSDPSYWGKGYSLTIYFFFLVFLYLIFLHIKTNHTSLDIPINNTLPLIPTQYIINTINDNAKLFDGIDNGITNCPICLDDFNKEKEIIVLKCDHIYHKECIIEWVKMNISCPLCRSESLI